MKKGAVFGNAGGGQSTQSRRLAEITEIPLFVLDIIQFRDDLLTRSSEQNRYTTPSTAGPDGHGAETPRSPRNSLLIIFMFYRTADETPPGGE